MRRLSELSVSEALSRPLAGLLAGLMALGVLLPAGVSPAGADGPPEPAGDGEVIEHAEEGYPRPVGADYRTPFVAAITADIAARARLGEPDGSWTLQREGDDFASPDETRFAGPSAALAQVGFGPAGALTANETGRFSPKAGAVLPAAEATYAFGRTEFGWHDPVYPDGASGVVAPRGNYVYVAKKVLIRNIPGYPGQSFSFAVVEVYTKAGVFATYAIRPLKYALDFVDGIDAYEEPGGNVSVYVAGSFDYRPMVAKFRHDRTANTFGLVATSGAPSLGNFAIMMTPKVYKVNGAPMVYVLGTDWVIPPGNPDGLADGIISRFDVNLKHINSTRIWTAAQGFPCKDEIEINSLYIDKFGVFTVTDVDKQSDHFIGNCLGRPPRGGISRTSHDLKTSTFKKFDDAPGTDFLSSDSLAGDGNGLIFITGHKTWQNLPIQIHLTKVTWSSSTGFSAFEHFAAGHPGGYQAGASMTIGGTRYREVAPGKADLVVAGWVTDSTENCLAGECSDWETWIGDALTVGNGIPFAVDHAAFTQSFVSPTYDQPFDIAPDADDVNVYWQVGCSDGTKKATGFSTDCYTIYPNSPNVNARMFKITVTSR